MNEKNEPTRAEMVRLRREQDQKKRMHRTLKDATRPMPPITTRTKSSTPKTKAARSQHASGARRRFQIAVPAAPDARPASGRRNFRISIPRPRFGWRLVSFVTAAVLGTVIYFAFNLPLLRVTEAQLVGNQVLTATDVNSVLNIAGQPVFLLKPADLENRLRLNYPELVSVRVDVSLPNLVTVNVSERKPLIRWEQGGGYTWIAEDGIAFKPRGEIAELISVVAESAPPAGGESDPLNPAPFISLDMVQALRGLASHVPPGQSILYDARMGFGWNDPRGWRVYFGATGSDVELKMRVYESMVNSLTQRGIRPALINVTYPTAPYYRMTQ